jgi:hypothetical protein
LEDCNELAHRPYAADPDDIGARFCCDQDHGSNLGNGFNKNSGTYSQQHCRAVVYGDRRVDCRRADADAAIRADNDAWFQGADTATDTRTKRTHSHANSATDGNSVTGANRDAIARAD